jgi:twinkle protein
MPYFNVGIADSKDGLAPRAEWGLDQACGEALEARGLSVETAAKLGWLSCRGPTNSVDRWIAIPYVDQGRRVGTKYRTVAGSKLFTQAPGSAQILYNIDALRDPELAGYPLVITEGECDAHAAIQSGYLKTVSVPGGAPPSDDGGDGPKWHFLEHADELLKKQGLIILAVDGDANGIVLRNILIRKLGRSRCQVVEYPPGAKDLNDVLREHGELAVRKTLATAQYVEVPGLFRLRQIPEPPRREATSTFIAGEALDPHLKIRQGDLVVVTGPPGHGKSSMVANLVCNLAWFKQMVSAICSMEQPVVPDLRRVFRSYRAECLERDMSEAQKQDADQWINDKFLFVQQEEGVDMTLDWVLERFTTAVVRCHASILVIDPWNEISISDQPDGWTTEQFISQSLRRIKQFARQHNVTVIIVAHPRKMQRNRDGKIPKPGLWDIADSASWANRCDVGIVIYRPRPQDDQTVEISVEKSRDHYSIGVPGTVSLKWEMHASRFVDLLLNR